MTIKLINRGAVAIKKLALLISVLVIGVATAQGQQVYSGFADTAVANNYTAYQVTDDATVHPGIGMRYTIEQDWFLFGEAHHANRVPKSQEPRLFNPDEPRLVLIGGGIYF